MLTRQLLLMTSFASIDAFLTPPFQVSKTSINTSRQPEPQQSRLTSLYADADANAEEGEQPPASEATDAALPSEDMSDILNSPAFLQRKVDVLKSDISAIQTEIDEANTLYLAAKEEWGPKFDKINDESRLMQERFAREGSQEARVANIDVVSKMVNLIDTYDRAFQSIDASTDEEIEIVNAYKATYDLILNSFQELNVTKVETVGAEFDYENHQAIMSMPSDEFEEGMVCQEMAPGWRCGEDLIRAAMVVVAA